MYVWKKNVEFFILIVTHTSIIQHASRYLIKRNIDHLEVDLKWQKRKQK